MEGKRPRHSALPARLLVCLETGTWSVGPARGQLRAPGQVTRAWARRPQGAGGGADSKSVAQGISPSGRRKPRQERPQQGHVVLAPLSSILTVGRRKLFIPLVLFLDVRGALL